MFTVRRLCLLIGVSAALGAGATSASADEFENDAGSFTGHAIVSLASGTQLYQSTSGNVNCSTVTGEGTLAEEDVPNNASTVVGSIESLDFTDGANQECDTNIFGVSSCATAVNFLPLQIVAREAGATDEISLRNTSFTLACETIVGDINCHYFSSEISSTVTGVAREFSLFNDTLTGEASNSFLCPDTFNLQATIQLKDESGDEIMLTEN